MNAEPTDSGWFQRFQSNEDLCPWPGPRPLRPSEGHLLVGREADRREFLNKVRYQKTVLLSGESGIGKSSLLNAGLIPDLTGTERTVLLCNSWPVQSEDDQIQPMRFLIRALHTAFNSPRDEGGLAQAGLFPGRDGDEEAVREILRLPDDDAAAEDVLEELDGRFRERLVLILDQFEELIRYSEAVANRILDAIAYIGKYYDVRIVLAYRSEYAYKVQRLEDAATAFSLASIAPLPLSPDDAEQLIDAPFKDGRRQPMLTPLAIRLVAETWRSALASTSSIGDPFENIGALHLQAFLYVLFFDGELVEGQPIDPAGLEDRWASVAKQAGSSDEPRPPVRQVLTSLTASEDPLEVERLRSTRLDALTEDESPTEPVIDPSASARLLFRLSIVRSVSLKLAHCHACMPADAGALADHALVAAARMSPHLSSGGYKLIREANELAVVSLKAQLSVLQFGDDAHLVRSHLEAFMSAVDGQRLGPGSGFEDLLDHRDAAIAAAIDRGDRDVAAVSSGYMFGMPASACLSEELRAFAIAMAWLRAADLMRQTVLTKGVRLCSLNHDGFGRAMSAWSAARSRQPDHAYSAVTACLGDALDWQGDNDDEQGTPGVTPDVPSAVEHTVRANLRWRGAWIRSNFTQVTFVNCDFSGSIFASCTFEAVRFISCKLDGVIFDRCHIVGPTDELPTTFDTAWPIHEARVRVRPDFRLGRSTVWTWLTNIGEDPQSGVARFDGPADPATGTVVLRVGGTDPEHPSTWTTIDLKPPVGGLTVVGSHLDGISFRDCSSGRGGRGDDGGIAFGFLRGRGLDVANHAGGSCRITASRIRHVSLFGNADEPLHGGSIVNSHLIQAVFGNHMVGNTTVTDSILTQAWNQQYPNRTHTVTATDSGPKATTVVASIGIDGGKQCPEALIAETVDQPDQRTSKNLL